MMTINQFSKSWRRRARIARTTRAMGWQSGQQRVEGQCSCLIFWFFSIKEKEHGLGLPKAILKKSLTLLVIIIAVNLSANAQTWNELFRQKKTQRKYLAQQIVLLKTYASHVKKGITVVQNGWTAVENVKNGDFNLHRDFFGSLNKVNPTIRNSAKVADIIAFQLYINRNMQELTDNCRRNQHFTVDEIRYVTHVYTNLIFLSDASLSELLTIISNDKLKMTDDERMDRIDTIYDEVKDRQSFVKAFSNDVYFVATEREREQLALQNLSANYGIR